MLLTNQKYSHNLRRIISYYILAKHWENRVCLWDQGNFWNEMRVNYWSVPNLSRVRSRRMKRA